MLTDHLLYILLGVGPGAVVAAIALGIVVGYRGSGVINFALGAQAAYVAYVFAELRDTGKYALPIPGLPGFIDLGAPLSMPLALVISLVTAALLGLICHLFVFRLLRQAPALAKVVASVGLMLVLQAVVVLRFGTNSRTVQAVLPGDSHSTKMFGVFIPDNRFYLAALVLMCAAGLWALFRFTRFGIATRAAAENEKGAILLGYSPDLQAGLNWMLSATLAGAAGIVVAPIIGLNPNNLTLLVVPALAAALIGRFTSFGVSAFAGLAIGMAQNELLNVRLGVDWLPTEGLQQLLPLLILIAAMFVLGRSLPRRGELSSSRLPLAPFPRNVPATTVISVLLAVALLFSLSGGYRLALITSLVGAVIALSLVVVTGYVGQISLAQVALAGTAGFMLSRLTETWGVPFPLAPILAVLVATGVGLLIAIPALRIRGVQLAVVTLAAAVAIEAMYFDNAALTGANLSSGVTVPSPEFFGLDFGITKGSSFPRPIFGIFVLAILVVVALAVANLRRSTTGRQMLAVRANERAAAAAGVNVSAVKLKAFGISAFIAGVGGVLIAYQRSDLSAASFGAFASLNFFAVAYLGGVTSISGAMIAGMLATGGIMFYAMDQAIGLGDYELLIGGLGLILTAILNPEGISGALRQTGNAIRQRIRPAHAAPLPQERGA